MVDAHTMAAMGVGLAGLATWHAGVGVRRVGGLREFRRLGSSLAGLSLVKDGPSESRVRTVFVEQGRLFLWTGLTPASLVTMVWALGFADSSAGASDPLAGISQFLLELSVAVFVLCAIGCLAGGCAWLVGNFFYINRMKDRAKDAMDTAALGMAAIALCTLTLNMYSLFGV